MPKAALRRGTPGHKRSGSCGSSQAFKASEVLKEAMAIGKLYKAGERKAKQSELGLNDPDAAAFFTAYTMAIDHGKHGDGIQLTDRLRKEVGLL